MEYSYNQIPVLLEKTNFEFSGQTKKLEGKVRDSYFIKIAGREFFISIPTGRTSVFNQSLNCIIPYQGVILNRISQMIFKKIEARDIVKTWVLDYPHPNVAVGECLDMIPYEFIVRNIPTGSVVKYLGGDSPWGSIFKGSLENMRLARPVFTPTRKSAMDEPISEQGIIEEGIITKETLEQIKLICFKINGLFCDIAYTAGYVAVDFKLEFGFNSDGELVMGDEGPSPHSARCWSNKNYEMYLRDSTTPLIQESKEYLRQLVLSKGFDPDKPVSDANIVPDITHTEANSVFEIYKESFYKFRTVLEPENTSEEFPPIKSIDEYLDSMYNRTKCYLEIASIV